MKNHPKLYGDQCNGPFSTNYSFQDSDAIPREHVISKIQLECVAFGWASMARLLERGLWSWVDLSLPLTPPPSAGCFLRVGVCTYSHRQWDSPAELSFFHQSQWVWPFTSSMRPGLHAGCPCLGTYKTNKSYLIGRKQKPVRISVSELECSCSRHSGWWLFPKF